MHITHIDYDRLDLELAEPYTIAYETLTRSTNFVLRLSTNDGLTGLGCAAPDRTVTGETADEVEAAIRNVITPTLLHERVGHYVRLMELLRGRIGPSARAMVDAALHDLIARRARLPLYQLLGGFRDALATSITVGILPPEETLRKAAEYVEQGFGIIKVKGGLDVEEDLLRLRLLRDRYPKLVLRFDGNQGYTLDDALRFIAGARSVGIEILEQPTSVDDEALLGEVSRRSGKLPVMADESLKTLKDAFRLTRHDFTDMINIKLQKVGGLLEGMHIDSVAHAAGNEVMVGCLDECGLGIAAGLHFALSRPNVAYADLDGHLEFVHDPFGGLVRIEKGVMYAGEGVGLGG